MDDRRIFQRFPVKLDLRYLDLSNGKDGLASTFNISAKGLGLLTTEELRTHSAVELWVKVSERGEPLYTRGEVVWSSQNLSGDFRSGINLEKAELMGLSRALRQALNS